MSTLKKHRITLTIEFESIYRDIYDKTLKLAKLQRLASEDADAGDELEAELQIEPSDDSNLLRGEMTTSLAFIGVMLSPWVWEKGHEADARIIKEEEVTIIMNAPLNFDLALRTPLARLIKTYIVNRTLGAWCQLTNPNRAAEYMTLAQEAEKGIKAIKSKRVRPLRNGTEVHIIVDSDNPNT